MRPNVPNTEYLRILFTGRSGSTKTRTAYSCVMDQRFGRVLGIDAKGQTRSIRKYRPQPDIISVESVADVTEIYNWLKAGQQKSSPFFTKLQRMGLELKPPYLTVVVDGWSEIQRWIVLGASGNVSKSAGDKLASVQIQDYGTILAQTLYMVDLFYSLPLHIISTVLEQERSNGENSPPDFRHQLVGQARDQLSSYPEIVGRLVHIDKVSERIKQAPAVAKQIEAEPETSSICFFRPGTRHEAKDQTGALGDLMINPSMTKILDLIEADNEE